MKRPPILILVIAPALALLGLFNLGGGTWLLTLGGGLYYALAGAALLAAAGLLWFQHALALHIFAGLIALTLLSATAEAGFDWWRLVPWVIFGPRQAEGSLSWR